MSRNSICDMINQIYLSVFQTRRATHLVGHHSHLRLLALSGLPIGLGRGLGLISTGHDYWRGERGEKHSERVCSFGRSSMFDGAKEGCMRDGSMWNNLYFFFFVPHRMRVYLTCLCVRCLCRASLRVYVPRSAPLPFIRWRP